MSKRFTDTEIWKKQTWYSELPPLFKLAWMYITDSCDHGGLWKIDVVELKKDTGIESFDLRDFVDQCNKDYDPFTGDEIIKERTKIVNDKWLWLTGFIQFQYGGKNGIIHENNITKSALQILESLSLFNEATNKGFLTLQKGSVRVKKGTERAKDKDKDKDNKVLNKKEKKQKSNHGQEGKETFAGCPVPEQLNEDGFIQRYGDYWEYAKPKFNLTQSIQTVQAQLRRLVELKNRGHPPLEVIDQTIRGENKEFYPLKDKQFEQKSTNNGKPDFNAISSDIDEILAGRKAADEASGSDTGP